MKFTDTSFKVTLAAASVALCVSFAPGQPGGDNRRGGGGWMSRMTAGGTSPDYMLRDLRRFEEALALSEEQTLIVEQILREYDESFREASEASQESMRGTFSSMRGSEDDPGRQQMQDMRDRMREIRDKMDSARQLSGEDGMKELQERLNKEMEAIRQSMNESRTSQWQSPERQAAMEELSLYVTDQLRVKKQMRAEFEGDLVAILDEEQLLAWPPLQRMLIRDRLLPRGRLSGETLDVMGLVEQQDYDDSTLSNLITALNSWDINVTLALQSRDDHLTENQGQLMSAMSTMDSGGSTQVMKEQARLAETVRQINDDAIDQIVQSLPSEDGATFKQISRERGYPRIFRPTRTQRSFQAAMELDQLEPDILQAIVELFDSLLVDLEYANEQILSATKQWEAQEQLDRINRFASRMSGGQSERAESPIRKAEDNRRKVEESYLEQLRLLLTEEQIESLGGLEARQPREDRGSWGRDRGNRDDHGGGNSAGREAFMQRFDKNGDGNIDDTEREQIREFFRNGGSHEDFAGQQNGNRGSRGSGNRQGGSRGGSGGR